MTHFPDIFPLEHEAIHAELHTSYIVCDGVAGTKEDFSSSLSLWRDLQAC